MIETRTEREMGKGRDTLRPPRFWRPNDKMPITLFNFNFFLQMRAHTIDLLEIFILVQHTMDFINFDRDENGVKD